MLKINTIYNKDCIEGMKQLKDNSIQLIIADPPYNIGKADWDEIPDYIDWSGKWLEEAERVLKDNGSLYLFHNDMEQIAELMIWIKKKTRFQFRQMITWNKRFKVSDTKHKSKHYGYLTGYLEVENLHNYQKIAEYILFYTFDNGYKLLERRKELGIPQKIIAQEVLSETGGITGWVSNIELGNSYPNKEQKLALEKHLKIDLSEFIPKFNNQKTHHSIWNYEIAERGDHETPKPSEVIETILKHSSDKGDLVLVPFSGSAAVELVCSEMRRNFIGFELNEEYYRAGLQKIKNRQIKISEFASV